MNINEAFPIPELVERVAKAMWIARCAHTMRTAGIELEAWGDDGVVPLANGIIEEAIAAIEAMRVPTEAMYKAASAYQDRLTPFYSGYQAAIDAALSRS